jgi:DNA-binding CsgD family transcriptional regulator
MITLTPAEVRILELLPTHLTLAQIAAHLFISRNTAKSQAAAIYRKLSVANRDEAVRRARDTGLLPAHVDAQVEPARGKGQGLVLAFRPRAAAAEAELHPKAQAPPPTRRPAGQIPRPAAQRDSLIPGSEGAAAPDAVMVVARGWAARERARSVRARAYRARQISFSLRPLPHHAGPGSGEVQQLMTSGERGSA